MALIYTRSGPVEWLNSEQCGPVEWRVSGQDYLRHVLTVPDGEIPLWVSSLTVRPSSESAPWLKYIAAVHRAVCQTEIPPAALLADNPDHLSCLPCSIWHAASGGAAPAQWLKTRLDAVR